MKIKKISQSAGVIANVVDSLESNSSVDALSAAMGKELQNNINSVDNTVETRAKEIANEALNKVGLYGQCKAITGKDLNTDLAHFSGFYMGSSLVNAPNDSTDWFYIMHLCHNETYNMQIAYSVTDLSQNYMRKQIGGTWSNWARIEHKEISFILGSTTYRATKGTTWLEWINSGYNTIGASSSNNRVTWISGSSQYYIQLQENDCDGTYEGQFVKPKDTIISGYTYPLFNEKV